MATLYDTLGVPKSASTDEIKKAYRKLAAKYHPDKNPGDASAEERFKDVQNAYDTLSDPGKRKAYDQFGTANGRPGFDPRDFNFRGGGNFRVEDLGDLGDLFGGLGGLFGRGGTRTRRPQPERGPDIEATVNLSFEDSLRGLETKIPVEVTTACRECGGTGAQPGTAPIICPECNGRGVISEAQGLFALSQPCPRCRGNGTVIEKPCAKCNGTGRERRTKRYSVKIPAGVKVGTTVEVPTPYGDRLSLKVKPGSQDGTLLRMRGHGAPKLNASGKGDLLARLRLRVPKKLSKQEKQALEDLQKAQRENPREALFT